MAHTHLIQIGNSQGIRIPKSIIEEAGLTNDLELKIVSEGLLISSIHKTRHGWAKAFQSPLDSKQEELLLGESLSNKFDKSEWEW